MDHIKHRIQPGTTDARSYIEYVSRSNFYLHQQPKEIRDCFEHPHLVYWSGAYIIQRMKYGLIHDSNGIPFHVAFFDKLSRGQILSNLKGQFALSFRRPKPEFNLVNVVLIKGAENV